MNKNSLIATKLALVSFLLTIIIAILSFKINDENAYLLHTLIGLFAFIIVILSIIGIIKSIKSFNEPKKLRVIFGFITNLFFLTLYLFLILSNI